MKKDKFHHLGEVKSEGTHRKSESANRATSMFSLSVERAALTPASTKAEEIMIVERRMFRTEIGDVVQVKLEEKLRTCCKHTGWK